MVRVNKEVAKKREEICLSLIKNIEPQAKHDDDPNHRQAVEIIINSLMRTAYGGKSHRAFTDID